MGLYVNFVNLNTQNNEATIFAAKVAPQAGITVPLQVATQSDRSDFIALQAIEFPGINLFWGGSILMMVGLGFSLVVRLRKKLLREAI
ncbi:MAG: cytochrome c biogenesis protein ResB [Lewinella sp.]|nr:cytochrome c biogenesis protein ResB [Lewinella sp.]